MSYNADSIEIVAQSGFRISSERLNELRATTKGDNRPESSFLDEDWEARNGNPWEAIRFLWWSGDGSGHTFEKFEELLAAFEGSADLVICWEGGDSYTGVRLLDHVVTEHRVLMALGDPK